ncbi:SDR family NAD(P)-dependent oxidoreductase [Sphaerotilus mobilis]|uniref:Benzil reductase ((S)-benzoin forming) n=1 Tax=Sphaerotilus mobilis TaxID=47994 RepID=A0A4Q7L980_9BURK|nr:SDR family NAD(P)-dependent oxidoreductase [Sphaerotilus mobilis]RZS46645.1 benzil reductase ((S)-benzoin forming) [Sphaerotilus mobilis]
MRLAILTGGSRGLGLALHEQLTQAGWRVLEFSRTAPHRDSVRLDLADPTQIASLVRPALARVAAELTETIEALVAISNAGVLDPIGPASRKDPAAVLANLQANFTSAILFQSVVVAQFQNLACRKVLANLSSGAALKGYAGWSLYGAAKAGLEHHIRAVAVEQASEAHPFIALNVDPGVMDTAMQALIREQAPADFPDVARFIRRQADGELRPPGDVAAAILRLLERTDLVSGQRCVAADF